MIQLLCPTPDRRPAIPSIDEFGGRRLVFSARSGWSRYPEYVSEQEYLFDRNALILGALAALDIDDDGSPIQLSPMIRGGSWPSFPLQLWGWTPGDGIDSDWDQAVQRYASELSLWPINPDYGGVISSNQPRETMELIADLVLKNLAPDSPFIWRSERGFPVYFHNTFSIGVCVPLSDEHDASIRRTVGRYLYFQYAL